MLRSPMAIIVILAFGLLVGAQAIHAQQPARIPRVGFLRTYPVPNFEEAFRQGLRELGYVEGQTLLIEQRYWQGSGERLADVVAELVRLNVDALVAPSMAEALAAKRATNTIPIITVAVSDPVQAGLIASMARPGGNVTGVASLTAGMHMKRLEFLKEALPRLSRVAMLYDPRRPDVSFWFSTTEMAARALELQLYPHEARELEELDGTFAAMAAEHADALLVVGAALFAANRARLAELALQYRLPTSFPERGFVEAGGLMSYGPNVPEMFRRAAYYVDRILKGVRPADLPVEEPMKFELIINLKTARAFGLTIPPALLVQADEVIR
ncbi:MAG: ABC transporter substrate-binding protein [Candidatus Entotheonellia bacterium]